MKFIVDHWSWFIFFLSGFALAVIWRLPSNRRLRQLEAACQRNTRALQALELLVARQSTKLNDVERYLENAPTGHFAKARLALVPREPQDTQPDLDEEKPA